MAFRRLLQEFYEASLWDCRLSSSVVIRFAARPFSPGILRRFIARAHMGVSEY